VLVGNELAAEGRAATRVVGSADARRAGLSGKDLRRASAAGRLTRVRRDSYVQSEAWSGASGREQHRLRVIAAARSLTTPVFSHYSAAAVWGLPLIGRWPDEVHIVRERRGGGRSWPGVVCHGARRPPPVTIQEGLAVTTAARTLLDLARVASFPAGVAAADHVLRSGLATDDDLLAELEAMGPVRGSRLARRVVDVADARSESVGESLSRARMIELGVPSPALQHEVTDRRGLIGRVDFWWAERRLVGEFDGRLKYRVDGIGDTRALEERVWAEKIREDRMRAAGVNVTRWTWAVALDRSRFAQHLTDAGLPVLPLP